MGQRLVIGFSIDGEEFCNAYFHWSGFTSASAETVNEIAANYALHIQEGDTEEEAVVNALYDFGAGMSGKETPENLAKISKKLKYVTATNRDDGLINLSQTNRANAWGWAEADIWLDVDDKSMRLNGTEICTCLDVGATRLTENTLQDMGLWLNISAADIKKLKKAYEEYIKDHSKAKKLCKSCSKIVKTVEHAEEALTPPGTFFVKNGTAVDGLGGQITSGDCASVFALDNGLAYLPIE
jgi:hypothetical protein